MKKLFAFLMSVILALATVACGEKEPSEFKVGNGVYKCGSEITPGTYTVTIDSKDGHLFFLVFATLDDFLSYQNSGAKTDREDTRAIELSGFSYGGISDDMPGYLDLRDGNVLLTHGDESTLTPSSADNDHRVYSGLYRVGESISENSYRMRGLNSSGTYLITFENMDKYLEYFRSDRYTGAEDDAALYEYSSSIVPIDEDEEAVVSLKNGQILFVAGAAEFEVF